MMRAPRAPGSPPGVFVCLLLIFAWSIPSATAEAVAPPKPLKSKSSLQSCGGALKCLGTQKLGRVRRRAGLAHKSVAEIAALLDADGDLALDVKAEMLVYSCSGMLPDLEQDDATSAGMDGTAAVVEPLPVSKTAAEAPHHHHHHMAGGGSSKAADVWRPDVPDAPISQADAFRLHSRPNATRKILLDFDGHVTQNSAWNVGRAAKIVTPAFDKDGSPSTWSAAELSDILAVWRGVSEDFAPWDVDVTTEDPGDAYLATNGMRVAIGGAWADWYDTSSGGTAFLGAFSRRDGFYGPAFVFAVTLKNNPKFIFESASHEIGHTLGLSHDGVKGSTAYYRGTAAEPRLWAPIMGTSYYCAVTQWSKGEYSGASNLEDDIQIISSSLGPPSLTDVHGGTFATATPLPATSNADGLTSTGASYGIIQGSSDVDMFSFNTTAAGCVQVTVTVPPRFGSEWTWARSDLAVGVAVLDASNNVLAASSGLGVSTSAVVPAAGTYYVSLSSVGMNDPATTGFSNYASAGQYKVTATYPITSPAASSYTADVAPLPPSVLLQC